MQPIQRAVLSCYDKSGLVPFAQALTEMGVALVSTSGTLHTLRDAGIPAQSLADFTGMPELLEGRVKSLHPNVHAGLLGVRDNKLHTEQLQAHGMHWIDLAVVNLQPLDEYFEREDLQVDEAMELVDIGGAAMLRSAAKNFRFVTPVPEPAHYTKILHALRAHDGVVPYAMRYRLAVEAFERLVAYDTALAAFLQRREAPAQ